MTPENIKLITRFVLTVLFLSIAGYLLAIDKALPAEFWGIGAALAGAAYAGETIARFLQNKETKNGS